MSKKYNVSYKSVFLYNNDGITVLFPGLPGCYTYGTSDSKAKQMAIDALKVYCEELLRTGPLPTKMSDLEISKWIEDHKKEWGKAKYSIKTIISNVEEF